MKSTLNGYKYVFSIIFEKCGVVFNVHFFLYKKFNLNVAFMMFDCVFCSKITKVRSPRKITKFSDRLAMKPTQPLRFSVHKKQLFRGCLK